MDGKKTTVLKRPEKWKERVLMLFHDGCKLRKTIKKFKTFLKARVVKITP